MGQRLFLSSNQTHEWTDKEHRNCKHKKKLIQLTQVTHTRNLS